MHMWTAIVIIVIVSSIAKVIGGRGANWGRRNRDDRYAERYPVPAPIDPNPALQREVEELRKRIAVLERIATDDRHSRAIADEIEALRDPRPIAPAASPFTVAPPSAMARDVS